METRSVSYDDYLFIYCIGRLDSISSANCEFDFCRYILKNQNPKNIVLDMRDTSYVSSAGLRVLLGLAKRLRAKDRILHIQNANPLVSKIILVAGFHFFVKLHESPIVVEPPLVN